MIEEPILVLWQGTTISKSKRMSSWPPQHSPIIYFSPTYGTKQIQATILFAIYWNIITDIIVSTFI